MAVDGQCFGKVVLGGEGVHQVAVAAFAEWGELDELLASADSAGEFGSGDAEFGGRVALQGTQTKDGELVADLADPGCVLAGEEAAFGDEQGGEDRPPSAEPVVLGDGGLGAVDGLDGGFEVYPGAGQTEPQVRPSTAAAPSTRRSFESSGLSRPSTAAGSGSCQSASASSSRGSSRCRLTAR